MTEYVEPKLISHRLNFYGLVESGFENKLLTLNRRGEFSYLNLNTPESPRLEVITPGFPSVGGQLISDAENRVAWVVRGRGVYFIDLDTKKTGHMIAGNYGRIIQVLLTDKEKLLFLASTLAAGAVIMTLYAYGLLTNTDYGEVGASRICSFNALGMNRVLSETQQHPTDSRLIGWYLSDTFFTKENNTREEDLPILPGTEPLTKALTDNHVHAINGIADKLLHQDKRLFYAWSYISRLGPIQPVLVRWNSSLDDVSINPLLLQMRDTKTLLYQGSAHMSGDGNWLKWLRTHTQTQPRLEELIVFHLQDYYPQGVSMPVSLGYTNKDPGAFMNHSSLGPCYIEQSTTRERTLLIYKLNDAVEILKRQALELLPKG